MPVTLDDIYKKHREWLYITDTRIIDLKLAMEICRQMHVVEGGKPVWMIIVAPSGSAKSEFLDTMLKGMPDTVYDLPMMTSKSFVTGYRGGIDHVVEMNHKLVIVLDASRMTSLHSDTKHSVYTQLRDLFDGNAGQNTGGDKNSKYKGLKVTMLWGAVPAIEKEIIMEGELGTRFLMYYYDPPSSKQAMDMMLKRTNVEGLKLETGQMELMLCREIEIKKVWQSVIITDEIKKELEEVAENLAIMRASCEINWYLGAPMDLAAKEEPTRAFGQFMMLYRALMSLDPNYSHERAMDIIRHIAYSSGHRLRHRVLKVIASSNPHITTSDLSEKMKVAYLRLRPECHILWQFGLVDRKEVVHTDAIGRESIVEAWSFHEPQTRQLKMDENEET